MCPRKSSPPRIKCRYTPSRKLKVCYPDLYSRIKEDFGSIPHVLNVLGSCQRHKLEALSNLVDLAPPGMRLRIIGADDERDFFSRIQQACHCSRCSPNGSGTILFNELFEFYNSECDFAVNPVDTPTRFLHLKRTISMDGMVRF
jgi:hypothetical protein